MNKSIKKNTPGYVLVITIMIIALSVTLITTIYQRFFVYQDVTRLTINREKAKSLALGGIQVALAQLSLIKEEIESSKDSKDNSKEANNKDNKESDNKESQKKELSAEQKWLTQVLPLINRWQTVNLTEDITGVNGTLELYLASENGKINLNQFSKEDPKKAEQSAEESTELSNNQEKKEEVEKKKDPEQKQDDKQEKKESFKVVSDILVNKTGINWAQIAQEKISQLGRPLIGATEILTSNLLTSEFTQGLFVKPEEIDQKYHFMDLFTVFSNSYKLNIWLLSQSTLKALGFTSVKSDETKDLVKKFKPQLDLEKDFKEIFASVYGITDEDIEKKLDIFAAEFDVEAFSVVSYATVGTIKIGVCAIVERIKESHGYASESFIFRIKRLYWL